MSLFRSDALCHIAVRAHYCASSVEYLQVNVKDLELANLPTTTLAEVADATTQGIKGICQREDLVIGFLAHRTYPRPMNRQPNPRISLRVSVMPGR
jgi:hypothetical protein